MKDNINHPSHYTQGNIEVIDYIEDKKLGYHLGNIVKYISRAGLKESSSKIEDLKKAQWYLNRYIKLIDTIKIEEIKFYAEGKVVESTKTLTCPFCGEVIVLDWGGFMILSGKEIEREINNGNIVINHFHRNQVTQTAIT